MIPLSLLHLQTSSKMIRTRPLETDDDNTIELDLNAYSDTIFTDRVYLKWWQDPDKTDALPVHIKDKDKAGPRSRTQRNVLFDRVLASPRRALVRPRAVLASTLVRASF